MKTQEQEVSWWKIIHGNMATPRAVFTLWLACHERLAKKERFGELRIRSMTYLNYKMLYINFSYMKFVLIFNIPTIFLSSLSSFVPMSILHLKWKFFHLYLVVMPLLSHNRIHRLNTLLKKTLYIRSLD